MALYKGHEMGDLHQSLYQNAHSDRRPTTKTRRWVRKLACEPRLSCHPTGQLGIVGSIRSILISDSSISSNNRVHLKQFLTLAILSVRTDNTSKFMATL